MRWLPICTLPLLLLPFFSAGQNIIVKGSFEELTNCPGSAGELGYAQPWNTGEGSSDVMNVCGLYEWGVPVNRGGGQWPRTGNGYAGIGTYSTFFIEARETLWQPIRYTLVGGEEYYFEAFVSLKDSFHYATHNIGIVFEDTMLGGTSDLECLFQCPPAVENTSANSLSSKSEWVKVSGTFVAQGNEKFIHIGNLRNDVNSEIELVGGGVGVEYSWEESGYYVDDVWLSHVDSMHYVGMEELDLEIKPSLYPNPNTGYFTIQLEQPYSQAELVVWDVSGKMVLSQELNNDVNSIQTELKSGLYLYGVFVDGQMKRSGKISVIED